MAPALAESWDGEGKMLEQTYYEVRFRAIACDQKGAKMLRVKHGP
jgi:hypothetical protein